MRWCGWRGRGRSATARCSCTKCRRRCASAMGSGGNWRCRDGAGRARLRRRAAFAGAGWRWRGDSVSDRKAGIALDDLLAQQRPLARFPERCRMDDPVAKRTAIGTIAARDRAWNADELGPHFIARWAPPRIGVTAHIHEFDVWGKLRIGNGVSALQVKTPGVFE